MTDTGWQVFTDEQLGAHCTQADLCWSLEEGTEAEGLTNSALADTQCRVCADQADRRHGPGAISQAILLGRITIPGRAEHVRLARWLTAALLDENVGIADAAVLLVSELVSNSVLHSDSRLPGGMITVTLIGVRGGIRAEVTDQGSATIPALTTAPVAAEPTENGRGLLLVEQLSARWGVVSAPGCTVTWFELMGLSG